MKKFFVWLWWWVSTRACWRCEKQTKHSKLYDQSFNIFQSKVCGGCWQELRAEHIAEVEKNKFEAEVENQKRILLAKEEAARRLESGSSYRKPIRKCSWCHYILVNGSCPNHGPCPWPCDGP